MEAVIKVKVSELNTSLIERIKALFKDNEDAELTILFDEKRAEYFKILNRSISDFENNRNLTSFTIDELEEYTERHKPNA
jgi:hypothetical protein